jgi:Ni/Fe-hydrogenase 1 B-type cytochrome subunit
MSASAAGVESRERSAAGTRAGEAAGYERVYVWDAVVRLTHWIIMLCVLGLTGTGIYIGRPFLAPSAAAQPPLLMANIKVAHYYLAIVFTLSVLLRIAWMFAGPYYARWHQLVPVTRQRLRDMRRVFRFYVFLDRKPPLSVGHNPLAGFFYLLVFGLYLLLITTGLALYSVSATGWMETWDFLLPIFGGARSARWLHHVAMWLVLGFVAHHIWSGILTARVEGMGLMDSMFSGYKFLPRGWRDRNG